MKRIGLLTLCAVLFVSVAPADGKKKHKKHKGLGPVVTVTAVGNTVSAIGAESTATATCPPGKQVIGGGFSGPLNNNVGLVTHNSYRSSPESWTATARDLVGGGSGALTVYAYCRNKTKSPISDSVQTASVTGVVDTKVLSPTCPAGTQLVAGGFQSTLGASPSDYMIIDQNAPGPGAGAWTVTGVNPTPSTKTITAHAYCLAGIRVPTIITQSSSGTSSFLQPITATTAGCPTPPKPKKGKKKRKKKPARLLSAGGFNGTIAALSGPVLLWTDSLIGSPGWKASATNIASAATVSITSYGVCV